MLGQVVNEGVVIRPMEVKYKGGAKHKKVVASKDAGGNYRLSVVPV